VRGTGEFFIFLRRALAHSRKFGNQQMLRRSEATSQLCLSFDTN
jgi:hypothetical protein